MSAAGYIPHVSYDRWIPGWVHCNCPIGTDHDRRLA